MILLRRLSTSDYLNEVIQKIIDYDVVEALLRMAQQSEFLQLKMEALWVLTNMCSGSHHHCQHLVDKGVIRVFMEALKEGHNNVIDQAVWGLGNIAADCAELALAVQEEGGLEMLMHSAGGCRRYRVFINACWGMANVLREIPHEDYYKYREAWLFLCQAVRSDHIRGEQLSETLNILGDKIVNPINIFDDIFISGIVPYAVRRGYSLINDIKQTHIGSEGLKTLYSTLQAALNILGEMVRSNVACTDVALDCDTIALLEEILYTPRLEDTPFIREALWMISNVTAGSHQQVELVLNNPNLLEKIEEYMKEGEILERI